MTRRRGGVLLLQTILGIVLLVAWLRAVDLEQVWGTLREARWAFVVLAAAILLVSGLLRTARWRLVLFPMAAVPFPQLWFIVLTSNLINFVIPLRTGELARSLFLRERRGIPVAASLATVLLDRAFDLAAVLAIGALGAITISEFGQSSVLVLSGGFVLLAAFAILVGLAIWGQRGARDWFPRVASTGPAKGLTTRVLRVVERFVQGISTIRRRPADVGVMFAISVATALLDALAFYCLVRSLGGEASLAQVILGYSLFSLTFLIPAAPGYIGSAELYGSLVFAGAGLATNLAASSVVLHHALTSVYLLVTGGLGLSALGLRPAPTVREVLGRVAAPDPEAGGSEGR